MLLNKSAEIFESKPFSKQPLSTSHQPKDYQKGSQKPQQLSSDFSEHQYPAAQPHPGQTIRNISSLSQHVGLAAPSSQQLSHYQTKHQQQQMFGGQNSNNYQNGPPQNQLMMTLEQTAMQHQHHQSQELVELQQERMSYSGDKRQAIDISQSNSRPCRTALSSLSQKNYPSNSAIDQQARPNLQPLVPHQVSLTATGMYEHTSVGGLGPMTRQAVSGALLLTTQHRPHHKSLGGTHKSYGAGNNYSQHVMLTAKASQKQNRLRSPLGGFLQGATSKQTGNTGYNIDYSHTIDASQTALLNGNQTHNGEQKEESDLGDDLDDEDESRTLFNQFVARTNLGLNRKPSNSTTLSGMTLPQKKSMNVFTSHSTRAQQAHQLPAQSNLSNQYRQPKELKQQIKKASKIGLAHAASIKQKLFLLETISSGDEQLLQALAVNSANSCCSHSSSDMDDDLDYMNEHPSSQDHRRGTGGGHHSSSCEFRQLRKDPAILIAELSSLIRAVTTGAVWPQYQGSAVNNDGPDEAFSQRSQNALNDAFKDAFVSQLSFHDMIEMLDMTAEVAIDSRTLASESIPCSALRLINQLAEGKITIQKQFFAAGLLQKLQRFTEIDSREIKVEVAYFIGQVFSHAKELICQYMGCQGYQIQLDFINLTGDDQFGENLYLIMFAIDSILVMFEEVPQIIVASRSSLSQTQTSHFNTQTTNKRLQKHSSSQISIAGMSYADLAKTLTKAGLIKPLVNQIQNFIQLIVTTGDETSNEFGYSSSANQSQQGVMYLERIFDILIDLAICGQHSVRKVICSPPVMCDELIQMVQTIIAIDSHSSPLKYMVAKWFVKLIIALTFQQQTVSNTGEKDTGSAISQKVIFELLGRSNVVVVLSQLIPLYTEYHANYPEQASSYLATLYETLKLLNLLTKMSASRSEQACLQGNVVLGLYDLITYIEELDQQQSSPASQISRSKKSRLLNACLQLLHELVVASFNTRTTLLDYGIPTLLLQLYNRKLVNYNNAIMSQNEQLHREQNKSQGQSLSLQSANSNLRANNVTASAHANTAAQNHEIVESIRDIFVVWVQQDDQTGQIMQEFLADQHSLI